MHPARGLPIEAHVEEAPERTGDRVTTTHKIRDDDQAKMVELEEETPAASYRACRARNSPRAFRERTPSFSKIRCAWLRTV